MNGEDVRCLGRLSCFPLEMKQWDIRKGSPRSQHLSHFSVWFCLEQGPPAGAVLGAEQREAERAPGHLVGV